MKKKTVPNLVTQMPLEIYESHGRWAKLTSAKIEVPWEMGMVVFLPR